MNGHDELECNALQALCDNCQMFCRQQLLPLDSCVTFSPPLENILDFKAGPPECWSSFSTARPVPQAPCMILSFAPVDSPDLPLASLQRERSGFTLPLTWCSSCPAIGLLDCLLPRRELSEISNAITISNHDESQ